MPSLNTNMACTGPDRPPEISRTHVRPSSQMLSACRSRARTREHIDSRQPTPRSVAACCVPSGIVNRTGNVDRCAGSVCGRAKLSVLKRLSVVEWFPLAALYTATVTRRKVAGMEVVSLLALLFWLSNRASSSFARSPARPLFSAASKAFMVGP